MTHRSAVSILMLVAVLWSLGGVLIKSVEWHPLGIAGARSGIAAVILWAWLRRPQFSWSVNQVGAALAYVGTVSLFVIATQWTTAANAIFLQYTAPIYVAIAGPLVLRERARHADWICVGVAVAGIALFLKDDFTPTGGWGIVAALGSGLSFATMVIFLRREKDGSPLSALLLGNVAAALLGLPFAIAQPPPGGAWLPLLGLGVVQLGIPYLLYGIAIRRVTALEATLIPMLEPILNPLWVGLVHGEIPGVWSMAGAALVLVAVLFRALGSGKV
jgi:drug/metabolite transporter (DMT)-like permease